MWQDMDPDKRLQKWLMMRLDQLKAKRGRTEQRRWDAYAMMAFRTSQDKDAGQLIKPRHLYDSKHVICLDTFVDGVMANLCSPNVKWFKLLTRGRSGEDADDIEGSLDWLEDCEVRIMQHFNSSHYYPEARLAVKDAAVGGTSFELVTVDARRGRIIHDTLDPQECYIDEDDAHVVDTFFQEFSMTLWQYVHKFGQEDLPPKLREEADKERWDVRVNMVHAICPVDQMPKECRHLVKAKVKGWASIWYEEADNVVFKVDGYALFPVIVHRYERDDSSPYGIGLVMKLMPMLEKYQHDVKNFGIGSDKQLSPMMWAPQSLEDKFDSRPGTVLFGNQSDGIPQPIQTVLDLSSVSREVAQELQDLRQMFYNDLFQMVAQDDVQRTKYEVQRIEGRRLMLLSGVIGNMQYEKFNPTIMTTLFDMLQLNAIAPPPLDMMRQARGGQLPFGFIVELDGLLAQNLKAYQQLNGMDGGIEAVTMVASINNQVLANFDFDKLSRKYAMAKGMPQDCIREKSEVKQIRQQQLAMAQAAAEQQQMLNASQVYKNLGGQSGSPLSGGVA